MQSFSSKRARNTFTGFVQAANVDLPKQGDAFTNQIQTLRQKLAKQNKTKQNLTQPKQNSKQKTLLLHSNYNH